MDGCTSQLSSLRVRSVAKIGREFCSVVLRALVLQMDNDFINPFNSWNQLFPTKKLHTEMIIALWLFNPSLIDSGYLSGLDQ